MYSPTFFVFISRNAPKVEKIEVEFGKDGKPFFISGPYDKVDSVISKLEKAVGKGNFTFLAGMPDTNNGFSFLNSPFSSYDDEEDEEDDDENQIEETDYEEIK